MATTHLGFISTSGGCPSYREDYIAKYLVDLDMVFLRGELSGS